MKREIKRQQREENILLSLKKLDYLSRSQLQKLHNLKSERNANRVLKNMSDYLSSFRDGEAIYYLNQEGRERVNSTKVLKKTAQARHYIMRNALYIARGRPATWQNEMEIGVEGKVKVVCDALYTMNKRLHIIEVDNTQKMIKNRDKINRYRQLIELHAFDITPKFIWITKTEYRRKQLQDLNKGLDCSVYTMKDFQ